jgi:hypothetical protein
MGQNTVHLGLCDPCAKTRAKVIKPMRPKGIGMHRDQRGVMRPMLPQSAVIFVQGFKMRGLIGRQPRKQNHIMRPRQGVDTVQLHKTKTVDQRRKITLFPLGQGMRLKKHMPCFKVWDEHGS